MNLLKNEWQAAFSIIETLESKGFEAVIVGGAVRDYLLGRNVHDVDVATSALPSEMKEIFEHTVDVGITHGTVLVLHTLAPVEVTTFRTDGEYSDHRRPDIVKFVRSLDQDLLRRDFTINAMAMRRDESIVDLYGGQQHLALKLICAVGNAEARFSEDALRMLRAVRFAAQLGFTIEDNTLLAIQSYAKDIQHIARERVKVELDKIWISAHIYDGIVWMEKSGLDQYLIGDFHAKDWQFFEASAPVEGWAYFTLLNRHIETLIQHYRLSNKEKAFVKAVIEAYDILVADGWKVIDYFKFDEDVLIIAWRFATYLQQPVSGITATTIQEKKAQLVIQSKDDLVVNGLDLLEWSGRKRGPWLKEALDAVLLAVLNGQCHNNRTTIREWFLNEFNKG